MTPSNRPHADKEQDHHMFWRKKEFRFAGREANRMRLYGAFIIPIMGWKHDMLHTAIEPLTPPEPEICDLVYDIAINEPADYSKLDRLDSIIDRIADEATHEPSAHRSDQIMQVAFHLVSQSAIMRLER